MKLGISIFDHRNDDPGDAPSQGYRPCRSCGFDHRIDHAEAVVACSKARREWESEAE